MFCPKCNILTMNKADKNGNWVAVCRNPMCPNYDKPIKVIIPSEETSPTDEDK